MPKNDSILNRLFGDLFKRNKSDIENIDAAIEKNIKDSIPSANNSGEDRAFTDLLSKYFFNDGKSPQYTFSNKGISGSSKDMFGFLMKDIDGKFVDAVQRRDLFNTYRYLIKNIPQLNAAIDVIVENILAPDDIFKEVLRIAPSNKYYNPTDELNAETKIEASFMNVILNKLRMEEQLFSWLSNCLLTGNTYIEIIDAREVQKTFLAESVDVNTNKNLIDTIKREEAKYVRKLLESHNISKNEIYTIEYFENNKKIKKEINEYAFVESFINNDIISLDDDLSETINFIKENREQFNVGAISDKDYRDLVFNKKFDDHSGKQKTSKQSTKTDANTNLENRVNDGTASIDDIFLKQHDSENIIKITNNGFLLGYLVVKEKSMDTGVQNKLFGTIGNSLDVTVSAKNELTNDKITDIILNKIVDKYSKESKFKSLNKEHLDTPDVRKLISSIIMEKKTANVRFVPPSNMIEFINHSQYGVKDYGTSILDSCLFLAKYYIALLVSYTIFNITRAPEKRLFKVAVQTDTNVKNAIEEVVRNVKQKDLAFRNFHKQDALPKELTAFDDIFVPMINGETPISIEGIPGQSSNIDTSYLDEIRRMIINATKVPPSLLGDTENSYHTTASQENQKFARTILRYQQQFQTQLTSAVSKIYSLIVVNASVKYNKISFNPPLFTKVEQLATMIGQADAVCNFISDSYGIDKSTQMPKLPKSVIAREIAKFIDWDKMDALYDKHKIDSVQTNILSNIQNTDKPIDAEVDNEMNNNIQQ